MKNSEFKYLTNDELMTIDGGAWQLVAFGVFVAGSIVAGVLKSWFED